MSNGNGPAFPRVMQQPFGLPGNLPMATPGLSKRELVAAICLYGLLQSGGEKHKKVDAAIEYAELLLSELEESK